MKKLARSLFFYQSNRIKERKRVLLAQYLPPRLMASSTHCWEKKSENKCINLQPLHLPLAWNSIVEWGEINSEGAFLFLFKNDSKKSDIIYSWSPMWHPLLNLDKTILSQKYGNPLSKASIYGSLIKSSLYISLIPGTSCTEGSVYTLHAL